MNIRWERANNVKSVNGKTLHGTSLEAVRFISSGFE